MLSFFFFFWLISVISGQWSFSVCKIAHCPLFNLQFDNTIELKEWSFYFSTYFQIGKMNAQLWMSYAAFFSLFLLEKWKKNLEIVEIESSLLWPMTNDQCKPNQGKQFSLFSSSHLCVSACLIVCLDGWKEEEKKEKNLKKPMCDHFHFIEVN